MNFDGEHIVNIVDLFRIIEKLVKKNELFEFKGDIRIFFLPLLHIMKFDENH